jgi:hypothetical protein
LAIPASLQASLLARLDRLAPVREVAQIGATLGRQFSHELIGAVVRMPPAQLDDALAQLVGGELIYRRGTPPDAEYTFKHALVQDAAYGTLLRTRRQQLHAHIAATLRRPVPGDRRGPAGAARSPLSERGADGEGARVLARRRETGLGEFGGDGSRRAAPARAGAGPRPARRRLAPGTRA